MFGDGGQRQRIPVQMDGEYGLYVGFTEGGLDVRWLTREPRPGVVRAFVSGVLVHEQRTNPGCAHAAVLNTEGPMVTLEYGDADPPGTLYRTVVRLGSAAPPQVKYSADDVPDSVYVFGDVHGEFDRVRIHLRQAGLVDDRNQWTGGSATVVFLGDLLDRGRDVIRLLWFIYELEQSAAAAGGRVLTLLGNHEVMVMAGDLRYVAPKEQRIAEQHGLSYAHLFHPSTSVLGRWLAHKPSLVLLDDILLAHGGVSPSFVRASLEDVQDRLRAYISEPLMPLWHDSLRLEEYVRENRITRRELIRRFNFFFSPQSPLWYRDLVLADTLGSHVDDILRRFGASVHVVAHTPVRNIVELYEGKLIAVDLMAPALEMLLLRRRKDEKGWDRFRVSLEGEMSLLLP